MATPKKKDQKTPIDDGALVPEFDAAQDNITPLHPSASISSRSISEEERIKLDEYERNAKDAFLDDEEGDAPGDRNEISKPLIVKNVPKYANFRASPVTFDLWGTTDRQGMDDLLFCTSKTFAPNFEDDVDLRRVRFFETVTAPDGIVRLVWCLVPEKSARDSNNWLTSKLAALEHAQTRWTTMRSRKKLQQYTYRPSTKQEEYGEPKFSGRSRDEWLAELKKLGMYVDSKDHPFYRKATDSE